ncbi:MAG: hypothetical protein ACOYVD_05220 [Bacillota bacterium]
MNTSMRKLDLELTLITARIYKYLKIKSGISIDILNHNFSKTDMLFLPQLILLAAQGPKGISNKIRTLAVISQIMYLSTEIHNQIPENENNLFKEKVQLPILVGDFLYSRFYEILCIEDCYEYLDDFVNYISKLNLDWINYTNNKLTQEELCASWYGELGRLTGELASSTSGFNSYWIKSIKGYGFSMGCIFGAGKMGLNPKTVNNYWNNLQEDINLIPPGDLKDSFSLYAHNVYKNLFNCQIQENIRYSAAAEI